MKWLHKLLGHAPEPTPLERVKAASDAVIVQTYRRISDNSGGNLAPTSATSDEEIVATYRQVVGAFQEAGQSRGEHIPAENLNTIVLLFLQHLEKMPEGFVGDHLDYQLKFYLENGLREDYKRRTTLF